MTSKNAPPSSEARSHRPGPDATDPTMHRAQHGRLGWGLKGVSGETRLEEGAPQAEGMPMSQTGTLSLARSTRIAREALTAVPAYLVGLIYLWWALIVFEPERYIAAMVGGPWYRIPGLLAPVLLLIVLRAGGWRFVYWPLACFTLLHIAAIFYAENIGFPLVHSKFLLLMLLTSVAAIFIAEVPSRVVTLLKLYLLGFIWYGVQGIPDGLVRWHQDLSDGDAYGPLMGIGFGYSYSFALSIRSRLWRLVAYFSAAVACVGVVASFARGAVLSFATVLVVLWLRSPTKMRTLVGGLVVAGVTLTAIEVLFPGGAFWDEMETVSEGTQAGTGLVRRVIWELAVQLWTQHPILGIGAGNFGVVAAQTFSDDPDRPAFAFMYQIWGQQLHNLYVQILCEEGLVGILLFAWATIGFFVRARRFRSVSVTNEWRSQGGQLDLRFVSLAFELGMIGFLTNAVFYNQLYVHWYWTLLALSLALERCTRNRGDGATAGSPTVRPDADTPVPAPRRLGATAPAGQGSSYDAE